jgi:hypothetical protein
MAAATSGIATCVRGAGCLIGVAADVLAARGASVARKMSPTTTENADIERIKRWLESMDDFPSGFVFKPPPERSPQDLSQRTLPGKFSHSGMSPFFESFFACFSFRFSFSDLPTFLELC